MLLPKWTWACLANTLFLPSSFYYHTVFYKIIFYVTFTLKWLLSLHLAGVETSIYSVLCLLQTRILDVFAMAKHTNQNYLKVTSCNNEVNLGILSWSFFWITPTKNVSFKSKIVEKNGETLSKKHQLYASTL